MLLSIFIVEFRSSEFPFSGGSLPMSLVDNCFINDFSRRVKHFVSIMLIIDAINIYILIEDVLNSSILYVIYSIC